MTQTIDSPTTLSTTDTMRAAVVTEFGAPLEICDLELPAPGYGEALVKLETSGVCHTDLHAAQGDWPVKPQPPFCWLSHSVSQPVRQYSHLPHADHSQALPTLSPTFRSVTPSPRATTVP